MISAHRVVGLALTGSALALIGALGQPAAAQGPACKAEAVTVAGKAKFRPFSKTKELEGRGAAMADAVAKWERHVGAKLGQPWKTWAKAKDTTFTCEEGEGGKVVGASFIGCTISGRPCATATAAVAPAAPRDKRGRGEDAAARSKAPPPPESSSSTNPRWSPEYVREMESQERAAEQRRKAEAEAYEREMALQEKMAAERWKGEQRQEQNSARRR